MASLTRSVADLQELPEIEPISTYHESALGKCVVTCGLGTCRYTCGKLSCGYTVGPLQEEDFPGAFVVSA